MATETNQDLFFNNRHGKPCDLCNQASFLGFYVLRRCRECNSPYIYLCYSCNEQVRRGQIHQKVCLLPNPKRRRSQELPLPLPPIPQVGCCPNPQERQDLALP